MNCHMIDLDKESDLRDNEIVNQRIEEQKNIDATFDRMRSKPNNGKLWNTPK